MKHFLKDVSMLMNGPLLGFDYMVDNTPQEFRTKDKSFKYSCTLNLGILMGPLSVTFY